MQKKHNKDFLMKYRLFERHPSIVYKSLERTKNEDLQNEETLSLENSKEKVKQSPRAISNFKVNESALKLIGKIQK